MNRKTFLASAGMITGAGLLKNNLSLANSTEDEAIFKKPLYLKSGDTVGITSPAGFITLERIQPAVQQLQNWGYKVKIGSTIGKRDFGFGGTDTERAADLQQLLDDPSIKAILCARGGYGSIRIVDSLDWTKFKAKPKWVIGFSDVTVLHNHIHRNCNTASIHSKMCNSFPEDWSKAEPVQIETINSIHDALSGKRMQYSISPSPENKLGSAEGVLIGGNLKTIETLAGSTSDIATAGKILFVEDTGEYLYSVDRMFWNLKRTGKLKALKGLIIGGFDLKPDDEGEEFGRTLEDIVLDKVKEYKYPICFNFPVGHQRANYALKCGVKHRLKVEANAVSLEEV
jgi:muramoyltetrapeptide carboxypeptidase